MAHPISCARSCGTAGLGRVPSVLHGTEHDESLKAGHGLDGALEPLVETRSITSRSLTPAADPPNGGGLRDPWLATRIRRGTGQRVLLPRRRFARVEGFRVHRLRVGTAQ